MEGEVNAPAGQLTYYEQKGGKNLQSSKFKKQSTRRKERDNKSLANG